MDEFAGLGATVVGCSVDTVADQKAFAEKLDLRFPLLADPDASICGAYGVVREDYGGLAGRATVIVDVDGAVAKTYPDAPSEGHAGQVLADLDELLGG